MTKMYPKLPKPACKSLMRFEMRHKDGRREKARRIFSAVEGMIVVGVFLYLVFSHFSIF